MKSPFQRLLLLALLATSPAFVACNGNDDPEPQTVFTADPVGNVTTLKSATITPQNGTPTTGSLTLVSDGNNNQFVQLADNFTSDFHTGTVTIYLAKAATNIGAQRRAAASNVKAVSFVNMNGKQAFRISDNMSAGFTHVVFYCETAEINFGAAQLQ